MLLGIGAISALAGAWIVAQPEMELGHVIGALLVGLGLALAAIGAALVARGRARWALAGGYAGAVAGALASRLWLGFRPMGFADTLPWLLVMILAGPVLAAAETPIAVIVGAGVGIAVAVAGVRRRAT